MRGKFLPQAIIERRIVFFPSLRLFPNFLDPKSELDSSFPQCFSFDDCAHLENVTFTILVCPSSSAVCPFVFLQHTWFFLTMFSPLLSVQVAFDFPFFSPEWIDLSFRPTPQLFFFRTLWCQKWTLWGSTFFVLVPRPAIPYLELCALTPSMPRFLPNKTLHMPFSAAPLYYTAPVFPSSVPSGSPLFLPLKVRQITRIVPHFKTSPRSYGLLTPIFASSSWSFRV